MSINENDLQLGKRAMARGFISTTSLQSAIVEHSRRAAQSAGSAGSLGFFLLSKGLLSPEQLADLMRMDDAPVRPAPAPVQPTPATPEAVHRFGKYAIVGELGRGSMGEVLEAVDTVSKRPVALKRPFIKHRAGTVDLKDEERFLVEASIASLLPKHPNLVEVYDSGKIDGHCFIAMELVQGPSMAVWRTTATFRQEAGVILQVARGLHHAHEYGVIHRDLKPSNVMIRPDGTAVVTDFGLAKSIHWKGCVSLTPIGFMVGSPGYMSPEQACCTRNVDRRTDVYSLGVMLYQALTGRKPFEGRSALEILLRMQQEAVRRPSEILRGGLNPVLYAELETVCMRALQRNPRDRHATAKAFAEDLASSMEGLREAAHTTGLAG